MPVVGGFARVYGPIALSCKTDNPCGEAPPKKASHAGVRMSMNETVYLFALSVPDMLEPLISDRSETAAETRPSESEERPS